MAEPLISRIADAAESALRGIRRPDYAIDVPYVRRPWARGIDEAPADCGIILVAGDSAPADDHSAPLTHARRQEFRAICVLRASPDDQETFDARAFRAACAMAKALMADPQWGGLAIDTAIGACSMLSSEDGGFDGVELAFAVLHRTVDTDWTTQA